MCYMFLITAQGNQKTFVHLLHTFFIAIDDSKLCIKVFFILQTCLPNLVVCVLRAVSNCKCLNILCDSLYRLYAISFENMLVGRVVWRTFL